jgi:hypothetical protein
MKLRTPARAIAISTIAALTLAAPVSAIAATTHAPSRSATTSRLDRSHDRSLRDAGRSLDRSVDRTHGSADRYGS